MSEPIINPHEIENVDTLIDFLQMDTILGECIYCPCNDICNEIKGTERDKHETCGSLKKEWLNNIMRKEDSNETK